ncbi:MAG: zinc ribbon domain-containing protein [Planctomycetota bacterium]|nr:MAG: zinc ribbon domain-containing protein [Planctomycetota bacterium]
MPIYEYRTKNDAEACDHCRQVFEVQQSMKDEPIAACPQCGNPVERIISKCTVSTSQSVKSMLSDKNLKQKGFTKLVNEGGGKFRNTTD